MFIPGAMPGSASICFLSASGAIAGSAVAWRPSRRSADGEALGGVPVDVNEAFGDWNEGPAPAPGYSQPVQGQAAQPQAPAGYPAGAQQAAPVPVQGYPQQVPQVPTGQGYPQQGGQPPVQGYPMQTGATAFQNGVAAAGSILPPQLFGEGQGSRVA